ncbi:MAG: hypothetical protein GXO91_09995 [FCB group bacterium]|nr:hypothetical protein [FCB group bacterium]
MKLKISAVLLMMIMGVMPATAQNLVVNPSFENAGMPSLENWDINCYAESSEDAPEGYGEWSMRLESGNFEGCFPGIATQILPDIVYSPSSVPVVNLSGWMKTEEGFQALSKIGLGVPETGELLFSVTADSMEWFYVELVDTLLNLSPGTAYGVILDAGSIGGPGAAHTRFDGISLTMTGSFNKGDVNADGTTNIIDIILMVGIILNFNTPNEYEQWAGDMDLDNDIDILDIINAMLIPIASK